jgi:signal transduction histidine kinase
MIRNWFPSRSIRWQITGLAIGPVILVALLAILTQPLTPEIYESTSYGERTQIRVETVVEQVKAAETADQVSAILSAVNRSGLRVKTVPASELQGSGEDSDAYEDVREIVRAKLPASLHAVVREKTRDGALSQVLIVQAGSTALAFAPRLDAPDALIRDRQINVIVKATIAIVLVLISSIFAGWLISSPLKRFADAVHSLDPDEGPDRPFPEGGSLEMRKLATSLNDMRGRVHDMLADRTRMVRAISHDLRTPLTRLRLKAERSAEPDLRLAMLRDITRLDEMIKETLTFLNKDASGEERVPVDLPSVLQTVCADFADMGFEVAYEGPDRFAYPCKPLALTRAISNLVDNGTKFASTVIARLVVGEDGAIHIRVEDDGPGIPEELRRKVLEPFFKGNTARPANGRGGFGLGLSIVNDVVHSHGGTVDLLDRDPNGLIVSVRLPALAAIPVQAKAKPASKAVAATSRPVLAGNIS